jgi:hypothetical protein
MPVTDTKVVVMGVDVVNCIVLEARMQALGKVPWMTTPIPSCA